MTISAEPRPVTKIVDPITSPVWERLVSSRPSTIFHSPQWMKILRDTYELPFSAVILKKNGRVAGGVPWSQTTDLLGTRRITLPFSDFCDILADNPETARILAEHTAIPGQPWVLRTLARNLPKVEIPMVSSTLFKWQFIDLLPDVSALWNRMTPSVRRGVRKAERDGVKVALATDKQHLRDWYILHLKLRKTKYGLLAQPYIFFENIWDALIEKEQGFLLLATYRGRVIAGSIYLNWRDTCNFKFNASDPTT